MFSTLKQFFAQFEAVDHWFCSVGLFAALVVTIAFRAIGAVDPKYAGACLGLGLFSAFCALCCFGGLLERFLAFARTRCTRKSKG